MSQLKFFIKLIALFAVLLFFMSCQDIQQETYYYGVEIKDRLVGYAEMKILPGSIKDDRETKVQRKIHMNMKLMGPAFDIKIDELYHLDPLTKQVKFYESNILQGNMRMGEKVRIENNKAFIKSKDGDKEKSIVVSPDIVIGTPAYYSHLIRDLDVNNRDWRKSFEILDTRKIQLGKVTYQWLGKEEITIEGEIINVYRFNFHDSITALNGEIWIDQRDGRLIKTKAPDRYFYQSDASIVKKVKTSEIDDFIFAKVDTFIEDFTSIRYMKVWAKILSLGELITPEKLNFPGQKFTGTVKDNIIEGEFEIQHKKFDKANVSSFPPSYHEKDQLRKYLEPADMIESEDPMIIQQAKEITIGSKDCWDAVVRLSDWVAKNIGYEIPGGSARHTLNTRKGECASHSRLLAALCRAVGIPARLATGCMYTPNYGGSFGQHVWNEVYMGEKNGWIPIDSTVREIDYIDSGHIRLGELTTFNPREMKILDFKANKIKGEDLSLMQKKSTIPWKMGNNYSYRYFYDGNFLGTDSFKMKKEMNDTGKTVYRCSHQLNLQGRVTSGEWKITDRGIPLAYELTGKVGKIDYSINCEFLSDRVIEKATQSGQPLERTIPLEGQVYLLDNNNMSLFAFLFSTINWKEEKELTLKVFHPTSMMILPLKIKVKDRDIISIAEKEYPCWSLDIQFAGTPLKMWVDDNGRILKDEEQSGKLIVQLVNPREESNNESQLFSDYMLIIPLVIGIFSFGLIYYLKRKKEL